MCGKPYRGFESPPLRLKTPVFPGFFRFLEQTHQMSLNLFCLATLLRSRDAKELQKNGWGSRGQIAALRPRALPCLSSSPESRTGARRQRLWSFSRRISCQSLRKEFVFCLTSDCFRSYQQSGRTRRTPRRSKKPRILHLTTAVAAFLQRPTQQSASATGRDGQSLRASDRPGRS